MSFNFTFEEKITNLNTYYFISHEKTIVDVNWGRLFDTWDALPLPFQVYFSPTEHKAEIATYLGFAWNLSQSFDCFVIPNHYSQDAKKQTGLPYQTISWQYQADPNWNGNVVADQAQNKKSKNWLKNWFTRKTYPQPKIAGWQSATGQAGIFQVSKFMELANIHLATTSDAASEISLFCLKPDRLNDLLTMLRGSHKPDLAKFLIQDELFIHIQLGIDLGYSDCVLVKSLSNISEKVFSLAHQYEQAVSDYEKDCQKSQTLEQALIRLKELSQGKITA